jgi:hypothetical protein
MMIHATHLLVDRMLNAQTEYVRVYLNIRVILILVADQSVS